MHRVVIKAVNLFCETLDMEKEREKQKKKKKKKAAQLKHAAHHKAEQQHDDETQVRTDTQGADSSIERTIINNKD